MQNNPQNPTRNNIMVKSIKSFNKSIPKNQNFVSPQKPQNFSKNTSKNISISKNNLKQNNIQFLKTKGSLSNLSNINSQNNLFSTSENFNQNSLSEMQSLTSFQRLKSLDNIARLPSNTSNIGSPTTSIKNHHQKTNSALLNQKNNNIQKTKQQIQNYSKITVNQNNYIQQDSQKHNKNKQFNFPQPQPQCSTPTPRNQNNNNNEAGNTDFLQPLEPITKKKVSISDINFPDMSVSNASSIHKEPHSALKQKPIIKNSAFSNQKSPQQQGIQDSTLVNNTNQKQSPNQTLFQKYQNQSQQRKQQQQKEEEQTEDEEGSNLIKNHFFITQQESARNNLSSARKLQSQRTIDDKVQQKRDKIKRTQFLFKKELSKFQPNTPSTARNPKQNFLAFTQQKSDRNLTQTQTQSMSNTFKKPQNYFNFQDDEEEYQFSEKELLKIKQDKFKAMFDKTILNIKPDQQKYKIQRVALIKIEKDFKAEIKRIQEENMHQKTQQEIYEEQIMQISKTFKDLYQISEYHDHHFQMLSEIYTHQKKINNRPKWLKYIRSKDDLMGQALGKVYENLIKKTKMDKQKEDFSQFFQEFQKQYVDLYIKKLVEIIKSEDSDQLRIIKAIFHGGHSSDYVNDTIEDLYKVVAQIFIDNNFSAPELKNNDTYTSVYENCRVNKLEEKMLKQGPLFSKAPVQGQVKSPQKKKKTEEQNKHEQKIQKLLYSKSKMIVDFQKSHQDIPFQNENLYNEQLYYNFKIQRQQSQKRLNPTKQQKTTNFFNSYEDNQNYQQVQNIIEFSNEFLQHFKHDVELEKQKQLIKSMQGPPRKSNIQKLMEQVNKQQQGSNHQTGQNTPNSKSLFGSLNTSIDEDKNEIRQKQELKKVIKCDDFKEIHENAQEYLKQQDIYQKKPARKSSISSVEKQDPFTLVIPKYKIFNTILNENRSLQDSQAQMAKNDKFLEKLSRKTYSGFNLKKQDVIQKYNQHKKKFKNTSSRLLQSQQQQQQQEQNQKKLEQQQQQQQLQQNQEIEDEQ